MRDSDARVGKMWASQASGGSIGRFNWAVCVDWSMEPSGSSTDMPGLAGCLFAVLVRK
jgi:hypothetical protein